MNPRYVHAILMKETLSLEDLKGKIIDLNNKQVAIKAMELSQEVTSLALKELEEKKNAIKKQMHELVDKL